MLDLDHHLYGYAMEWLDERELLLRSDGSLVPFPPPPPDGGAYRSLMVQFARDRLAESGHEMHPDGTIHPIPTRPTE
jgi:hypothetical protein